MGSSVEATGWNRIYDTARKSEGEPPIPFVNTILTELGEEGKTQFGLYVGCGNGRNYVPLLDAGLHLHGMDISEEAIKQLKARCPEAEGKVFSADFSNFTSSQVFDYLVSIHVFQHGDTKDVTKLFDNVRMALKEHGRLFLRVNSASQRPYHEHQVIETSDDGGFTVLYSSGPKKGMKIHFFSQEELLKIMRNKGFSSLTPPYEVSESRQSPQTGTLARWETIWQKP